MLFNTGCTDENDSIAEERLLGQWLLFSVSGGFGGGEFPLDAEYITYFKPDSVVEYFRNDTMVGSSTYWIRRSSGVDFLYRQNSEIRSAIQFVGRDTYDL